MEGIFYNHSNFNKWENKIKKKSQYEKKFRILKTFNEIKKYLTKGISIINKEFFLASNGNDNGLKIQDEIKCYVGNNKILLEMNNSYGVFFIYKVGKKYNRKYITLENVKPYDKYFINEIMKSKDDDLFEKKFFSNKCKFNSNVFYRINNKNKNIENIVKKM